MGTKNKQKTKHVIFKLHCFANSRTLTPAEWSQYKVDEDRKLALYVSSVKSVVLVQLIVEKKHRNTL